MATTVTNDLPSDPETMLRQAATFALWQLDQHYKGGARRCPDAVREAAVMLSVVLATLEGYDSMSGYLAHLRGPECARFVAGVSRGLHQGD